MVKKIIYASLLVVLILMAWYTVSYWGGNSNNVLSTEIRLNHRESEEFEPEIARITLGVETTNTDLDQAFKINNQKMDNITEVLKEFDEIKFNTFNYQVMPINRIYEEKEVVNYRVLNQIEVVTNNLEQISSIINNVISAGANQVLSIQYSLENDREAVRVVTKKAITGLNKKAQYIAGELGREKVNLISINVNDQFTDNGFINYRLGAGVKSEAALPPVSPKKIKVTVDLNAVYKLF